jgi:hypothetical protein
VMIVRSDLGMSAGKVRPRIRLRERYTIGLRIRLDDRLRVGVY